MEECFVKFEQDLTELSAINLAKVIKEKKITVVEVIETFLTKIDKINPEINAFCTIMYEEARTAAKQADLAIEQGNSLGPLHGVPVAIKDMTPVKGVRLTLGSKLYENNIADFDSIVVERIKGAGGIIIGKTNTPEFAHKGTTDNAVFGPTLNPWDTRYIPGGSSGGSAAAVAAGLVPIAEGTDGGGSIRVPASLCGVFGFKPSFGRIPLDVFGPFNTHSPFLQFGPLSKSVEDSALLYDIMKGFSSVDPFVTEGGKDALPELEIDISELKVAYSSDFGYFEVDKEIQKACNIAVDTFKKIGCQVDEVDLNFEDPVENLENTWFDLWSGIFATSYGDLPKEKFSLLDPDVQGFIEHAKSLSIMDYLKSNDARKEAWNKIQFILDEYDVLITPTTAISAYKYKEGVPETINGKEINPILGLYLTYPLNITGHPAATAPIGLSSEGLPLGLQIIGSRLDDVKVLQVSRALEKAQPWIESYNKLRL